MLVVLVLARLLLPLFSRAELSVSVSFFLFGNFTFIVTTTCVIYSLFFWVMQKCIVDVPGGSLEIEWREDDNHVYMTAPAEAVMAQVSPTVMFT